MLIKIIVILIFLFILGSLGSALFHLVRGKGSTKRTANALTFRIALSVIAFLLLMLGYLTGMIQPHGISG